EDTPRRPWPAGRNVLRTRRTPEEKGRKTAIPVSSVDCVLDRQATCPRRPFRWCGGFWRRHRATAMIWVCTPPVQGRSHGSAPFRVRRHPRLSGGGDHCPCRFLGADRRL